MKTVLFIAANLLNAFDAFSTLHFVGNGTGTEMNPLMRIAIEIAPWFFLYVKFHLILFGTIIYYLADHKLTWLGLAYTTALFTAVAAVHVYGYHTVYFS